MAYKYPMREYLVRIPNCSVTKVNAYDKDDALDRVLNRDLGRVIEWLEIDSDSCAVVEQF